MNVTSATSSVFQAGPSYNSGSAQTDGQKYADIIAQLYQADPYQTRDQANASDAELSKFKADLSSKGAAQFLKDLNQDKIDSLVEQYRQKLMKEKESNPDQPMDINQMVSDFKKELLKEIEEARKADQQSAPAQQAYLSTADVMSAVSTAKNSESASQKTGGLLEQMLHPNGNSAHHKEDRLF